MTRTTAVFALLLLAACARSEEASMVPTDTNQATPKVETVRPERDDQEVALGAWRETLQGEQNVIEFGPDGAAPLFSLRCDARRGVLLQRHAPASGALPVMRVSVGGDTRQLAATSIAAPNPMLRGALAAGDPLLAAIGRATGPIAISVGDAAPLNLPGSPLIGAYIALCASGEGADTEAAAAGNNAAAASNAAADAGD